ncbi:MAG: DUF3565 domain-containing protein [Burkholderiaceae bacterium]|nr:DUF3565 domain-containing protein [Burkholderiaceae bacterium]
MQQPIVGYFEDDEGHWVAKLACGHNQHVRHNPPLVSRPWVLTHAGRDAKIGVLLACKKCDEGAPPDRIVR